MSSSEEKVQAPVPCQIIEYQGGSSDNEAISLFLLEWKRLSTAVSQVEEEEKGVCTQQFPCVCREATATASAAAVMMADASVAATAVPEVNGTLPDRTELRLCLCGALCGYTLLDVRPAVDFAQHGLIYSTNVPVCDLSARSHELPPPGGCISVLASTADDVTQALKYLGRYSVDTCIVVPPARAADFWGRVREASLLLSPTGDGPATVGLKAARLWHPSPLLAALVATVEQLLCPVQEESKMPLTALDLACGSGRDVVFLALRGWVAYGVDYLQKAITRAESLATCCGVSGTTHFRNCNLVRLHRRTQRREPLAGQAPTGAEEALTPAQKKAKTHEQDEEWPAATPTTFDLVHVARYLDRDLMPFFRSLVRPGGCLLYHTFMDGAQHSAVGRPRRAAFLLQPGELRRSFEADGWAVLHDTVRAISDGRNTSFFLAQRLNPS